MSKRLSLTGKRCILASFLITATASGCQPADPVPSLNPAVTALLARYEQFDTLTGECRWYRAKVTLARDIVGEMLLPDEHNPARFVPHDGSPLPDAARFGGAVAFPRGDVQLRERAFDYEGDVRLSGAVVTGELRCYGNSAYNPGADHSMSASFLVNAVEHMPKR